MPTSIIPSNRLKKSLRDGKSVIGTMIVEFRQPSVLQVMANARLDFVIIDNEHGAFNIETIADLSRAARQVGITPVVRVPEWSYAHITQPLDSGAQAIMAPRITDPQQVREILQMMKYPPTGRRGSVVARGHTELKSGSIVDTMRDANEESMLVVQIETKQALEKIDEILAVTGVDVALVGPTDLSVSLGVPGKMTDPVLVSAIGSVLDACRRHNVYPAIHMNDLTLASHWASKGMRIVSFNSEVGMLTQAVAGAVASLGAAMGREQH
jgi:2-keto-3-deoxy-L-rhamnonate aldolase RhmA